MKRQSIVRSIGIIATLMLFFSSLPPIAAAPYADPGFAHQWQQDEAKTANFWGPLATASGAKQESYADASNGERLVQYFDKGRMELTGGRVTNGLLATELLTGRVQMGDNTFEDDTPPAIPIAGDPDNPGPTYAAFSDKAATTRSPAPKNTGALISMKVAADGTVTRDDPRQGTGPLAVALYDDATRHNVPKAFADFRSSVGLDAIGFAITEPFHTSLKVGGKTRDVVVQAFERRILTYTATNPPPFTVEFGNIGRDYYQWRYGCGSSGDAGSPPAPNGIAFGVDTEHDRAMTNMIVVSQYARLVGGSPHIVHYFLDWKHGGNFSPTLDDAIIACGAVPFLTWNPHDQNSGANQPEYSDAVIAGGRYDALLARWGRDLGAWGGPFYLRIGDEMNGDWDAWSPGVNGNTVGDYLAMWRHVVGTMRAAGGGLPNVRFVWSPNVIWGVADFTGMYPGDGYVDWVGLDGYNWGTTRDPGWQSFSQIFGASYDLMGRLTQKPLMIPETGAVEQGGDKASWIRQTFLTDIPTHFPRVKAVIYFNENKRPYGEGDWRVDTSNASLAAFRQVVQSPLYQGKLI